MHGEDVDREGAGRWQGFLGLDDAGLAVADVALLPLPFDGAVSWSSGTADGPAAIWRASREVELWDPVTGFELDGLRWHAAPPPAIEVAAKPDDAQFAALSDAIEASAAGLHAPRGDGSRPLVVGVGGDHSVTPPLLRAAVAAHAGDAGDARDAGDVGDARDVTVVHLDAHADLRDTYDGTRYSHASPMARALELGASVRSVGIRSADRAEVEAGLRTGRLDIHWMHELVEPSAFAACVASLRELGGPVYLTIDVDALDPALCPGTGTPEPGGLSWWQLRQCVEAVAGPTGRGRLIGADVVETAPSPGTTVNEFTGAKIIAAVVASWATGGRRG